MYLCITDSPHTPTWWEAKGGILLPVSSLNHLLSTISLSKAWCIVKPHPLTASCTNAQWSSGMWSHIADRFSDTHWLMWTRKRVMESIYDLYNSGLRTKYQGVLHFSFSLNSSMVHPISLPPSLVPSFSLMALNGFITEHRNPGSVERVEARLFGREERSPLASLLSG